MKKDEEGTATPMDPAEQSGEGHEQQGVDRRRLLQGTLAGLAILGAGGASKAAKAAGIDGSPLVLRHEGLRRSVATLFTLANEDASIRQRLIENPTQIILESILPQGVGEIPEQRISEANRFLFSLLANEKFIRWAQEYQEKLSSGVAGGTLDPKSIDKLAIAQDMAAAFGRYGDKNLLVALANQTSLPARSPSLEVEVTVETYIAVAAVLVLVLVLIDFNLTNNMAAYDGRLAPAELRSIADQLMRQAKAKAAAGIVANSEAAIP